MGKVIGLIIKKKTTKAPDNNKNTQPETDVSSE